MYFEDLTKYSYYQFEALDNVYNVGWLGSEHEYNRGYVEHEFVLKLRQLIVGNLSINIHVNKIRSIHPCNLCGAGLITIGPDDPRFQVCLGASEIWIPFNRGAFAAPSMILHYIEGHQYYPPQEFIDAVMSMDSSEGFSGQDFYDELMISRHKARNLKEKKGP